MAGKTLSTEPLIDPTAKVQEATLGAYCEVGARTILLDVAIGDYSYVVNDAQITSTTIGKFCSIAAMTRINPGNHPGSLASRHFWTNMNHPLPLLPPTSDEVPHRDRH